MSLSKTNKFLIAGAGALAPIFSNLLALDAATMFTTFDLLEFSG